MPRSRLAQQVGSQLSLMLRPFAGPILPVKTGRSFTQNADPMNDWFQGHPLPACSASLLWEADVHLGSCGPDDDANCQ